MKVKICKQQISESNTYEFFTEKEVETTDGEKVQIPQSIGFFSKESLERTIQEAQEKLQAIEDARAHITP